MEKKAKELGVILEWGDYMRKCLVMIPAADAMYMLRGWEKSKGARLEHHIAQELGIEIMYQGGENFMWDDELQDKIAEMRAKYARIDIDQEIDNWMKEVIPDEI